MNGHINGNALWVQGDNRPPHKKFADISNPGPSGNLVFVDENRFTIDDGYFAIPVFTGSRGVRQNRWQNSPACRHGDSTVVGLADGHAEIWRMLEAKTCQNRGLDITTLPLDWVRSQIALVPQNPYLFYGSFAENLRIVKENATRYFLPQPIV